MTRASTSRWRDATLITATSRVFPLATVRFVFRGGAAHDPPGLDGLTAVMARMLERGTKTRSRERIAEEIESLGASLALSAGNDAFSVGVTALRKNLEKALDVVAEVLLAPALDAGEIDHLRTEMIGELSVSREEDRDIGDDLFRHALHGASTYGRFVHGTGASLPRITREDVVRRYSEAVNTRSLIVAAAGDIDADALAPMLDARLSQLPSREPLPAASAAAREPGKGVDVLLVDKPERSQTQIYLGHTARPATDPAFVPFVVAMHAFGGMFTAPLMQEVRVKRGWSYGAHARVEANRGDGIASLWTFPSNGDTIACIRLLLDLYRALGSSGVSDADLDAAKGHLLNMLAFELETPDQVVGRRVSEMVQGLPDDWLDRWTQGVSATSAGDAARAARAIVRTDGVVLTVVCTADPLIPDLQKIPEVRRISVIPFDADDPDSARTVFER